MCRNVARPFAAHNVFPGHPTCQTAHSTCRRPFLHRRTNSWHQKKFNATKEIFLFNYLPFSSPGRSLRFFAVFLEKHRYFLPFLPFLELLVPILPHSPRLSVEREKKEKCWYYVVPSIIEVSYQSAESSTKVVIPSTRLHFFGTFGIKNACFTNIFA